MGTYRVDDCENSWVPDYNKTPTQNYDWSYSNPYLQPGTTIDPREVISKTQYDLLLLQVSELRRRLEEVEERELVLIKKLMESLDGADDKTST